MLAYKKLTCQPLHILDVALIVLTAGIHACRRRSQVPSVALVEFSIGTHNRSEKSSEMAPKLRKGRVWVIPKIRKTEQTFGCKPSRPWKRNPAVIISITHTRLLANTSHTITYDYTKTRDVMNVTITDCRVRHVARSVQPCRNEFSAHSQHASRGVLKTESALFWKVALINIASNSPCHCNCRH